MVAVVAVATLVGCRKAPDPTAPLEEVAGSLAVQWTGFARGSFAAPARATWCPADSLLEVLAVRGDSGFGFALAVADSVRPSPHPVVAPSVVVSWRPLAIAALRWASDTAVGGYEANSGNIEVTEKVAAGVSGTIDLRLKLPESIDTIRLQGTFRRVAIEPASGACGRMQRPAGLR